MTLVLSFACPGVAVQVADRLVSEMRGTRLSAFDEMANKLVIYRATDAMVSIGYAGQAYIGEVPTDEWIVEVLTGQSISRGPGEFSGIRMGGVRVTTLGSALRKLREELPSVFPRAA